MRSGFGSSTPSNQKPVSICNGAVILPSAFRKYARAALHFARTRSLEVVALQASPILGAFLAPFTGGYFDSGRLVLLAAGSLLLTAHIFIFNDWAGRKTDLNDARRATKIFERRGIDSRQVVRLALALLVAANVALALVGLPVALLGAGITALGILYSCSINFGKGRPIVSSIIHLTGGMLHFLLGYSAFRPIDARGCLIGLYFGLVFAGGHLNQEVRDYEADLRSGIRTNAVVFGPQRTFLASLLIFTAAYATLAGLAAFSILPIGLLWAILLWPLHLVWSLQTLRRGLGFEATLWMQRRYRFLFALLGLAMLATAARH